MQLAYLQALCCSVAMTSDSGAKGRGKGPVQTIPFAGQPHETCPVRIPGYAHIAVVVTDEADAIEFYGKFGFKEVKREGNAVILSNPNTDEKFEVHLLLQTDGRYAGAYGKDSGVNVLMDLPDEKYPGHTHIAFNVPSLPTLRDFLTVCTVHISGERGQAAVFVRDPDRNTVELIGPLAGREEPLGPDSVLTSVNHVGIRVADPHATCRWYSEMLGFGERTMWYEPAEDPKTNGAPWLLFNQGQVEINLLLNVTARSDCGNVLLAGPASSGLCPGIVYAAFFVQNFDESIAFLESKGAKVLDDASAAAAFGLGSARISPTSYAKSRFMADTDGNFVRLVGA